jgi:hypothetical protein
MNTLTPFGANLAILIIIIIIFLFSSYYTINSESTGVKPFGPMWYVGLFGIGALSLFGVSKTFTI